MVIQRCPEAVLHVLVQTHLFGTSACDKDTCITTEAPLRDQELLVIRNPGNDGRQRESLNERCRADMGQAF